MVKGETPIGVAGAAEVLGVPITWNLLSRRSARVHCALLPHGQVPSFLRV